MGQRLIRTLIKLYPPSVPPVLHLRVTVPVATLLPPTACASSGRRDVEHKGVLELCE